MAISYLSGGRIQGTTTDLGYMGAFSTGRGVWCGGIDSGGYYNTMTYISIPTTGNSTDFGDLSRTSYSGSGCHSDTRGVIAVASNGSGSVNTLDYITIATPANSADFGDMTTVRRAAANGNAGNATYGLFMGGNDGSNTASIDYITIASTGNGTDFGDLSNAQTSSGGAVSSNTRAMIGGGYISGRTDTIDYVTIGTSGSGTDFGNLTRTKQGVGGCSNTVRGIFMAGYADGSPNDESTDIDYVTIATTGNAADFGDLTVKGEGVAAVSDNTRGVRAGGYNDGATSAVMNTMDFITISTLGNGTDFGDLLSGMYGQCSVDNSTI